VLERKAQERTRADSAFYLLDSEHSAFANRLALIDGAQRSPDLQYYAIHADSSTEVLLQRLRDAARHGVRVRILLDDFNTVGADAQVLRLAFEPNVEIFLFNPLPGSRESLLGRLLPSLPHMARVHKRMHNKLFIADNVMAIIGGRNLGDAYFGGDGQSSFVDLEVLAMGCVVAAMSASFDSYWNDDGLSHSEARFGRRRGETAQAGCHARQGPFAARRQAGNGHGRAHAHFAVGIVCGSLYRLATKDGARHSLPTHPTRAPEGSSCPAVASILLMTAVDPGANVGGKKCKHA